MSVRLHSLANAPVVQPRAREAVVSTVEARDQFAAKLGRGGDVQSTLRW